MRGKTTSLKQRTTFLAALCEMGNVTASAGAAGFSRAQAYALRSEDVSFAAAWDDAVAEACDRLEAEAWRLAVVGVEEPVIGRVGKDRDGILKNADGENLVIKKYSDTLMVTLLKAHKPDKYRERSENNVNLNGAVKAYIGLSPDDWSNAPPTE